MASTFTKKLQRTTIINTQMYSFNFRHLLPNRVTYGWTFCYWSENFSNFRGRQVGLINPRLATGLIPTSEVDKWVGKKKIPD